MIAFAWVLRRFLIHKNSYLPGPINVEELKDGVPVEAGASPAVKDLTAQFRKQLSETSLYPPTALPAQSSGETFLDLVGDVSLEPEKLATSLLRFASRLKPKVAYKVSGVLRLREQKPRFGMTVTITSYGIPGSRADTVWAETWQDVVDKAGHSVIAALLSVTRAGKKPPWQGWHGRELPVDLFTAYHEAEELAEERRFDDALDRCYQAVRLDPTNVYLRLQAAAYQEKLGSYLDGLETYYGAIRLGRMSTKSEDKRLTLSPLGLPRLFHLWDMCHRPGILQARFRYAVALGYSGTTAVEQWCDGRPGRSADARDRIRRALAPDFEERYGPVIADLFPWLDTGGKSTTEAAKGWVRSALDDRTQDDQNKAAVRLLFASACVYEMCRLAEDYPIGYHFSNARLTDWKLSWVSRRLNRDVWAPLQWARAWADYKENCKRSDRSKLGPPALCLGWRCLLHRAGVQEGRCALPGNVEVLMNQARLWVYREFLPWQDRYNMACTYSIAMAAADERRKPKFASLAIRELESAVHGAESGFLTIKRSWLLSGDPDLDPLREEEQFRHLVRQVFPSGDPDLSRFADPVEFEMAAYCQRLIESCAAVMEGIWHLRAMQSATDIHALTAWLQTERDIWRELSRVIQGRALTWTDRERLLQKVRQADHLVMLSKFGFPPAVPEYDEVPRTARKLHDPEDAESCVDEVRREFDRIMQELDDRILKRESLPPAWASDKSVAMCGRVDASGGRLGDDEIHELCTRYAAVWQRIRGVFDRTDGRALEDLDLAFQQLDRLVP
ncbi:hypothetical protein [Streptomyces sp. FXJ1.172]|uniref:hypothetical protein n=1 Tax=Streptomyces sp. FXJ1.172 TaxID=710705 RepID=UPI0007CF1673